MYLFICFIRPITWRCFPSLRYKPMDILCYARLPLPSRAVEPRKGLLKHMYCLPLGYRPVGVFCFRFCINGRVLIWIFVWCYRFLFLSFSFLSYFFQMYKSVLVFYRVMISLCTYFFHFVSCRVMVVCYIFVDVLLISVPSCTDCFVYLSSPSISCRLLH